MAKVDGTLDIPVMLTPHSGHTDPLKDIGQKDNFLTMLQFFSKTFSVSTRPSHIAQSQPLPDLCQK